ncbi:hypothetical protein ILYODFUR_035554 [Ilyodon furcidens]|uniref:Uncharacterized protein n=1 Tax=Ilyodon furcidens TaxID=33524 RepID=A0ABV0TF85_9TELE
MWRKQTELVGNMQKQKLVANRLKRNPGAISFSCTDLSRQKTAGHREKNAADHVAAALQSCVWVGHLFLETKPMRGKIQLPCLQGSRNQQRDWEELKSAYVQNSTFYQLQRSNLIPGPKKDPHSD